MLICNTKALVGRHFESGFGVRIENGRIKEMGTNLTPIPGEECIDGAGLILAPGYIDIHIHGYGANDTMHGKDDIRHMQQGLVQHGVTGFLPTTMAADYGDTRNALAGAKELMQQDDPAGSRVLGCHLEGPFLNVAKKGAQPAQYIFPPSMENYLRIAEGLEDAVKLMTIAPEVEGGMPLLCALKDKMALSAGHTVATAEQMAEYADAGLSQVTHLFNGMNALTHRAPGVPGAALTDDRIGVQIIADLLHLHPAVLKLAWRAKGVDRCYLITDAMEATGMPDGEYTLGANRVFVKNREARLEDGTIAGSTLTMDRAVKNMVETVGIPLEDALYMSSAAPANSIGECQRGRIDVGAHADLVLLNDALEVEKTIVGGVVKYSRA